MMRFSQKVNNIRANKAGIKNTDNKRIKYVNRTKTIKMREFDYKLFHILTSKFLIKPNFRNANLLNSCTTDTGI